MAVDRPPVLTRFFETWYDYKMDPDDLAVEEAHQQSIAEMKSFFFQETGRDFTAGTIKKSLGSLFGAWLKENNLPKLP